MSRRTKLYAPLLSWVLACGGGGDVDLGPTAAVEKQRIERIVVATGTIEPAREVEVRPRIAGIVERIHIEAGDLVEPEQILLEIERDILEAQVREAEAAVRAADVERRFAGIELDRVTRLEKRGAAAMREQDQAQARFESAQASLARAQANLDSLQVQLRYSTVRSTLAGRVLDVYVEEGNAVSPVTAVTGGTLLLSIAATESMHLKGLVDENEIARVELGQPARIRTEAFAEQVFTGQVSEISPVGQRIQNVTYFEVELQIQDDDQGRLRPRMSADADIVAETVEQALVIPETALRYQGDRIFVEVLDGDDSVSRSDVEVGIVDGDRVQVLNGLKAGQKVRLQ